MRSNRVTISAVICGLIVVVVSIGCSDPDTGSEPEDVVVEELVGYSLPAQLADLVLPIADQGKRFAEPQAKRLILSVNRRNECVFRMKNVGPVDDSLSRIAAIIREETKSVGRDQNGLSKMDLLIRAEREVGFDRVQKIMQICGSAGIEVNRVEFGCCGPEMDKVDHPEQGTLFKLPERKLDAYLPADSSGSAELIADGIVIEMFADDKDWKAFTIRAFGKVFGEQNNLTEFHDSLREAKGEKESLPVTIFPGKGIRYGHVLKVMNECHRAGLTDIAFSGIPLDE